jgi:transposase InsO family protein
VVEHDTVDLGELYAYTALDIFTKEPSVFIAGDLEMETGAQAFVFHSGFYHAGLATQDLEALTHQSDNGSEFRSAFVAAVEEAGAKHRYARPYKKNEQACLPAGRPTSRTLTRPCGVNAWARSTTPYPN